MTSDRQAISEIALTMWINDLRSYDQRVGYYANAGSLICWGLAGDLFVPSSSNTYRPVLTCFEGTYSRIVRRCPKSPSGKCNRSVNQLSFLRNTSWTRRTGGTHPDHGLTCGAYSKSSWLHFSLMGAGLRNTRKFHDNSLDRIASGRRYIALRPPLAYRQKTCFWKYTGRLRHKTKVRRSRVERY